MKNINKKMFNRIALLTLLLPVFTSCTDFMSSYGEDYVYTPEEVTSSAARTEGVLLTAYTMMPGVNYVNTEDYMTDDLVSNVLGTETQLLSTGGWNSSITPDYMNRQWAGYRAIAHINKFLELLDETQWHEDSHLNDLYLKKLKGEAYGLRAWFLADMLKRLGGVGEDGVLYGVPVVTKFLTSSEESKLQRSTYRECVDQIFSDCKVAIDNLPLKWTDEGLEQDEAAVMGAVYGNRINGLTVMALRARVALTAASPAFAASGITMEDAANYAADVIGANNGLVNLSAKDNEFWLQAGDKAYLESCNEMLWFSAYADGNTNEQLFFPPSLLGKGQANPTQSFIDSFADYNGVPIDDPNTENDIYYPYARRDPRIQKIVLYNDCVLDPNNWAYFPIRSGGKDAIGGDPFSSRTGYYVRKFVHMSCAPVNNTMTQSKHYITYARYTEVLLNFAEAAAEAWGPDQSVERNGISFSAREVLNAIRTRGGIKSTTYLDGVDDEKFKEIVRNERRIELFFEGFRFWDLRRWSTFDQPHPDINVDLQGVNVSGDGPMYDFEPIFIEKRKFENYMIAPPYPKSEILGSGIIQNKGW